MSVTALRAAERAATGATVRAVIDASLSCKRCENPSTRRAYAGVLDRVAERLGERAPATWNRNRAAVGSFLTWAARNGYPVPVLPAGLERLAEPRNATRAIERAAIERAAIERFLTRRDLPLRDKTLFRMLYETAARAGEILGLDIPDLDLAARRAIVRSKGGAIEYVYWGSGTAHLLPRLIRGRVAGPVRHSAATHLGEQNVSLQLIMAKTRHRNPRTAMRYVRPGPVAVAEVTELFDIAGRRSTGG